MDNIAEGLNMLLAPIGLKARTFLIDYRDNKDVDYNTTVYPTFNCCDDDVLIVNMINAFTLRGFTVIAITELFNGYSKNEFEAMFENDPDEAEKHMNILYYSIF